MSVGSEAFLNFIGRLINFLFVSRSRAMIVASSSSKVIKAAVGRVNESKSWNRELITVS